jgi:hypothetical protein
VLGAGGADAAFAAVGFAGGDFALQTRDHELLVCPGLGPGPFGQPRDRVPQRRSLRAGEEGDLAVQVTTRRRRRAGLLWLGGHDANPHSGSMPRAVSSTLTWFDIGPWKRMVAAKVYHDHAFPVPTRTDTVVSLINYRGPSERATTLVKFKWQRDHGVSRPADSQTAY